MTGLQGFWSYVHKDDAADGGRIARLARDVVSEYEVLTGEKIELFLDRDDLAWGDDWRARIDDRLASVAFFIAVITPRYLLSGECRRELLTFVRKAQEAGVRELALPLLYVDVAALKEASSDDEVIKIVRSLQREDWRELRFAEPVSEEYRRGVSRLAARLVEANRRTEEMPSGDAVQGGGLNSSQAEDPPGLIDRLGLTEEAMPKWADNLTRISAEVNRIGAIIQSAAGELNAPPAQAKPLAHRLSVARHVAAQLAEPVSAIEAVAREMPVLMENIDEGVRILISRAPDELATGRIELTAVCRFVAVLRENAATTQKVQPKIRELIDVIGGLESVSRDLRPVMRRFRRALELVHESFTPSDKWLLLISASGIECPEPSA